MKTMTDGRLAEIEVLTVKAHKEITRICSAPRGSWQMTIPVDKERDSDMIFTMALESIPDLVNEVLRLRRLLALTTVTHPVKRVVTRAGGAQ